MPESEPVMIALTDIAPRYPDARPGNGSAFDQRLGRGLGVMTVQLGELGLGPGHQPEQLLPVEPRLARGYLEQRQPAARLP